MFFDKAKGTSISNIIQLGAVEIESGVSEMITFNTLAYIEFDENLLKLKSVEQYSKLLLEFVDDYELDFEIEEDMILVKKSIAEIVLNDTMADNRIESIDIYGMGADFHENSMCDALSIHLVCGQEVFFDPTYYFGINIGGERQRELWLDNYPNTATLKIPKKTVNLLD